ncbi:MAG: hypothetical protein B7Z80_22845 [Rhodospirillales bacterium 20-64-7]|nr:MAG: hypothetical protein B7Z80_22845 [Rhodospirillales bacterium 20-64-7]
MRNARPRAGRFCVSTCRIARSVPALLLRTRWAFLAARSWGPDVGLDGFGKARDNDRAAD